MLMRGGRMDSKTPSTTHLTETELIDRLRLIRSDKCRTARYYGANATSLAACPFAPNAVHS